MRSNTPDLLGLQAWQDLAQNEDRECVIGAVILNAQGRAFVQKRSQERRLFPGCWDIVGGHVEPGETLYEGLHREIAEETGRQLAQVVAILGQFDWVADQKAKRELDVLVEVEGDLSDPQLEWSKHSEFRWINLDEIEILKENRPPGDTLIYDVVKKGLEWKK
ncbi:MAG: NUDIX domain-containing protein [Chloroflexota bacterium]|nr:NUDIX domain-containing protein [Chloroflexota bacterium]